MPNEDSQKTPTIAEPTIAEKDRWLAYSRNAWHAAGRPPELDPSLIEDDPVRYNAGYYDYFEHRFLDLWMKVYDRVKPNDGTLIRGEDSAFLVAWQRNFSWETTWKQLLPLFVYGSICGVNNEVLTELASHYCIGQAIPSTVIDRILDEPALNTMASDAVFAILCYTKGLAGLRKLGLKSELEDCFVEHTRTMYTIMLSEHAQRSKPLPRHLTDVIKAYSGPKSRLVSSIFFGVLPRWASRGHALPAGMEESIDKLRQVRQLNDEIADVEQDITRGLVTLPWLFGIEDDPDLRALIEELRNNPQSRDAAEACLKRLHETDALPRACSMTLQLLSESMQAVMDKLKFATSFDVTLLHNVRWAHVRRIIRNHYVDDRAPRQPLAPHSVLLTEALNPVAPVAGAGTVVTNSAGKVLMGLVSKRGMVRWELPGGVAKLQESMEAAARRETMEETGIDVKVAKPVALCWHYSRELGKGWMGVFFGASPIDPAAGESFLVIQDSALGHTRADPGRSPELYEAATPETFDFGRFDQQGTASSRLTSHENILAAGFVEWTRIPAGRMHPLHRKLLEARAPGQRIDQTIDLLVRDADTDLQAYEPGAPFYYIA